MTSQQAEYMQGSTTGESARPQLPYRKPYHGSGDQHTYHGREDPHDEIPWQPDERYYAPASHAVYHSTGRTSYPDSYSYSTGCPASPEPPPLPARPDNDPSVWLHVSPPSGRYSPGSEQRPHLQPGLRTPTGHDSSQSRSPERTDELDLLPPRRRLTTGDIPVTTVGYSRAPERVIAYLIPLPPPLAKGQALGVPQRYMIYTPPAPHLLKPDIPPGSGAKEGKRHRARRLVQQEVRKAKTYDGRALSLRGLHYKALRGCDRAVAAIRSPDITFLNRVPRKRATELVLIHPASVLADHTPGEVRAEVGAQLARTKKRAARDSAISTLLFPPALVIDTLAAVVWPFGGLAEIDGAWMYASISGYLTARNVTKRMGREPVVDGNGEGTRASVQARPENGLSPVSEEDIYSASIDTSRPVADGQARRDGRRDSRQVHFEEMLDDDEEEEEDLKRNAGKGGAGGRKRTLKVRVIPDHAMDTMASYFQEICHNRNPKAFGSSGVPPTKTDVLASIGWFPDSRGRAPGVENPGDWEDENWQTRQVKEDMDKVFTKAAKSWDKWCKSYAQYPERAMKEKGHSKTSEVLRKLRVKKDTRGPHFVV